MPNDRATWSKFGVIEEITDLFERSRPVLQGKTHQASYDVVETD